MKRYEFHSTLPLEEVFARLNVRAKKDAWLDPWLGRELFVYFRKENRFRLTYTGTIPMNGFIPFSGEVRAEGTGSVITGGFSVWRALCKLVAIMMGIMFVVALLMGAPPGFALFGAVLGFGWFLFGTWLAQSFFWERQKVVLKFIEENLLK